MSKTIQLKLLKIKYEGDSIGDDIRIEINCSDQYFGLDKQIKNGSQKEVNVTVAQLSVHSNQSLFTFPIEIKIIEKDAIFNDVGFIESKLEINQNEFLVKKYSFEIKVKESRGTILGSRTAIFVLDFETQVSENILYVPTTNDGWLTCYNVKTKIKTGLPNYLKIHLDKVESNKEFVTPLEGLLRGVQFWIKKDRDASLKFRKVNNQTNSVELIYSISSKILTIGNKKYKTTGSLEAPWKRGFYDIEIPDYPHIGGLNYNESKYGKVWFRVGHSGDRYLHTGRHSLGCMTVIEITKWDEICEKLIKARKGDGISVGILMVVE